MTIWRLIRRLLVIGIGAAVIGIGILLLVLPGPGILLILLGLLILSLEYPALRVWAERIREKRKQESDHQ